jgi:hypothetical protein
MYRRRSRARGAHDALVETVELGAVGFRLAPFLLRLGRLGFQVGLHVGVLRVEIREIRHEVFDDGLVRQRRDRDVAGKFVPALGAGDGVAAADIHGAGTANAFAAGAAEGERRVDLVLDVDENVEDHRPDLAHVDLVVIPARVAAGFRVVAIDLEGAQLLGRSRLRPALAGLVERVFW